MSRLTRRIALLLILVFTANVQSWAFTIGDELSHEFAETSSLNMQNADPASSDSHDCGPAGHHCCHALNHLLGQVSSDFSIVQISPAANLFPQLPDSAISVIPENIYHPPRLPSLT